MTGIDGIQKIEAWLGDRLAELLGSDRESIAPDEPFTKYGLDSLDAVSLVFDLEELLNVELPATLLWDHPTIRACSEYLAGATDTTAVFRRAAQ